MSWLQFSIPSPKEGKDWGQGDRQKKQLSIIWLWDEQDAQWLFIMERAELR